MTNVYNITLNGFSDTLSWDDWFADFAEEGTDHSVTVSKSSLDTMIDEFIGDFMEKLEEDLIRNMKTAALQVVDIQHLEELPEEVDEDGDIWPVPTNWTGKTTVTVDDPRMVPFVRELFEFVGEQLGANSNTRFTVSEFEPEVKGAETTLYGRIEQSS